MQGNNIKAVKSNISPRLGKLTLDQLRAYLKIERDFGPLVDELFSDIRADPRMLMRFGKDLMPWFDAYEGPITAQTELLYRAFGLAPMIASASKAADPNDALLKFASGDIPEDWVDSEPAADANARTFITSHNSIRN